MRVFLFTLIFLGLQHLAYTQSYLNSSEYDPDSPVFFHQDLSNSIVTQKGAVVNCGTGAGQTPYTIQIVSDSSYNSYDLTCAGTCTGYYTVNVSGGIGPFQFTWLATTNGTPKNLQSIEEVCDQSSIQVIVTDLGQGVSCGASHTLNVPSRLQTINFTLTQPSCPTTCDGTASHIPIFGVAPYDFMWSNGNTSQNANDLCLGLNTLTITDQNGCVFDTTITILNPPQIVANIVIQDVSCDGICDAVATSTPVNGNGGPYSFEWQQNPGGATLSTATGPGDSQGFLCENVSYTLFLEDVDGCPYDTTFTVPDVLPITLSEDASSDATCFNICDGSITVSVSGGSGIYTQIEWVEGTIASPIGTHDAGPSLFQNDLCPNTDYFIIVTDDGGCTNSFQLTPISSPPAFVFTMDSTNVTCNGDDDGSIDITLSGGTGPYNFTWTYIIPGSGLIVSNQNQTGLSGGTYQVLYEDNNNCKDSAQIEILEPEPIFTNGVVTDVSCFDLTDGDITVTTTGGNGGYIWTWTSTPNGNIIDPSLESQTGLDSAVYSLNIVDQLGCNYDTSFNLNKPGELFFNAILTDMDCFGDDDAVITLNPSNGVPNYIIDWGNPINQLNGPTSQSGLAPATYDITLTDANTCDKDTSIVVNEPPELILTLNNSSDISCFGFADGTIDLSLAGGTPAVVVDWTGGSTIIAQNDLNPTGLGPGSYTATATDANGCTDVVIVDIIEPNPLSVTILGTDLICNGVSNGAVDITPSGGPIGTSYLFDWDTDPRGDFNDSEDLTLQPAGTYCVNIQDDNGCTLAADSCVTIIEPDSIFFDGSIHTDITCNGDDDGTITLTVSGGTESGAYDFAWTVPGCSGPIGNISNLAGLCDGDYTVITTDDNGCTNDTTFTIIEPAPVFISETHINLVCADANTGSISITVSGGVAPLSVSWVSTTGTTPALDVLNPSNLEPGDYTATVTDANGCTDFVDITITTPLPLSLTISGTDLTCNGVPDGTVSIVPTGGTVAGNYTFDWDNDIRGDFNDPQNLAPLLAGTYCVNFRDDNGCTLAADSCYTIIEPDSIFFNGSTFTDMDCFGADNGVINLVVSGGTESGAYDFAWTVPGCSGAIGNVSSASGLCDGTYTIVASDDNGCTNDTTFVVTEPTPITLVLDSLDAGCGLSNGEVTVTPSGGTVAGAYGISWTGAVSGFIGTNLTETGLDPDTYTVVVTDDNGCSATDNIEVQTDTPPIITINSTTDVLCNSACTGAILTTITTTNPPYNVQWTGITDPTYSSTNEDIFTLCAGDYSITVTDANLCSAVQTVTISEPTPLELSNSNVTNIDCYQADNGAIDITATGGTVAGAYIYSWTGDNSYTNTSEDISALPPGNYCVNVTDDNGCSFASDSCFVITEPTELVIDALTSTDSQCGVPNGSATVSASGGTLTTGYTYLWDDPASQTTATATSLLNNAYTVIVTDNNGCSVNGTVAVNPTNGPAVTIDGFTDVTCSGAMNGTIQTTGSGGTGVLTYSWSTVDGSGIVPGDDDQPNLSGGTYVVTVTDGALCNSQEVVVLNEPDPIVILSAITDANCFGEDGLIDISVSGGTVAVDYSYDWDFNGIGAYVDPEDATQPAGTYNVSLIDDNGCPASAGPFVIAEPTDITLLTSSTVSTCLNPTGTVTVAASGGTPGNAPNEYTYVWTDGGGVQVGNTATVLSMFSGCYDVVVTDANGCTATTTECISDNPGPDLTETHFDVTCNGGSDGSIDLTIVSTALPVTVVWSSLGGSTISPTINDEDISSLASDDYSVVATDNNGCSAGLSVNIIEPNAIDIDALITNPFCSNSMDGAIDITVNNAVLPLTVISWSGPNGYSAGTEDISGLEAGQYCLHIEDANSCSLDTCITLSAPTTVSVSTSAIDSDCNAPTGQISASASGGNPGYSYEWFTDPGFTSSMGPGSTQSGLGLGTYYVIATDINGCTANGQQDIQESNAPSITIDAVNDADCFGNSSGDIFVTVSGGTPNYLYDWDNDGSGDNDDTEDLTGIPAGQYIITVTDAVGCTSKDTAVIAEPLAPLAISGVQTDLSCNGGATGEVTITVTGGTPNYTYDWTESGSLFSTATNGTGINTASGLSALVYDVQVTDNNGCTITDQYTLIEPTAITLVMSNLGSSCGNLDGEVSVIASGGTDGITYFYDWDIDGTGDNDDNATETGVPAGTYTVIVSDLNGCTATDLVAVSDVGGPTVVGTTTGVNCYGDANGTIDITVTGNPTFDFSWSGPNAYSSILEDLSMIEAGTYSVGVTDINGCITNEIFDVTGPAAPLAVVMDSTDLACFDDLSGAVNITVTGGTSPYLYSWSGPNGYIATTEDINSIEAGTYTVDITDDNGCALSSNSIDVIQPDSLEISFAILEPGCGLSDGTVTATIIGGTLTSPDYNYAWTDLGVPVLMPDTDADISGIGAGNYELTITDDNGCTQTNVASVSNDLAPSISVSTTDITCNGDDNGTIDITVNGVNIYTFDWDNDGTGDTDDSEDINLLSPGVYNVTVYEDPTGCISTASATIVEPDLLVVSGVGADLACFGDGSGDLTITVTGGTLNYNFDWDNLPGSNDPQNQTGLDAGTYQVTVTDANLCVAIDSYTLVEPSQITITAALTQNDCFGETAGEIDITVSNGVLPYSYSWDSPSTNEDLINLQAGTYTVTVTDGNLCTEDSTFTITEAPAIIFDVTTVDANCTFSDGSATSNVSGGTLTSPDYGYDWQFGGSSIAATPDILGRPAGTYIFYVTDDNGCQEDTTVVINNINAPTITLDNTSDVTCFGSNDGTADVTVSGGTAPYTYLWNPNGISQLEDLTGAPADTYSLQVTDDAGCISTLTGVVIDTPDELTSSSVTVDATCGICNGEATITGTGGSGALSYVWSNGNSGTLGTALCSGIYSVQITDANGCSVNEDVTINDNGGPTGETLTTTDATCAGSMDGTAIIAAVGGTAPYSYFWPHDGSTGDTQSTLTAGSYNVEMIDDNGCIRVVPVDILEPTPITISSVVTPSTCGNSDGAITITTNGGVSPLTILWTSPAAVAGQTTAGVSGLAAGIYTVEVTDFNGCTETANITISDINAPSISLTPSDVLCNGDATGSITSTVTGAVGTIGYEWFDATPTSTGITTADITNVGIGDYTLQVTDAGTGCITNATATVEEPDALVLSVPNTTDASCDISCDGEATAIVSGGTLGYNYSWSSGANGATASNLCVGLNTVTITDNNGCIIQTSVMIDTNFTLDATVAATDATCGICNGEATVTPIGGSGSYDVNWSDGTNGLTASSLCSGFYPFEVLDITTGCSVQLDATINDIGGPTGETLNITDVTCNGGNDGAATVVPTGGTTPYSYNWVGISNTTNNIAGVGAGSYTLQVTDDNGCTRNVPVEIIEPVATDVQYIATDGTCGNADGSITLIVSGANPPYTYLWTAGPSAVGSVNDAESGLLPGIYTIEITDNSGCVETLDIALGTTNGPSLTMSSTDETCHGLGDGTGAVIAVGNNPFVYNWTSGSALDTESGLTQGQYFVTVTDALGCVSNGSVQIDSPDSLVLGLPNVIDASCSIACDGEATVIITGGTLNYSYSWSGGQTSQTATGLCVGVNNVNITDANGCQIQASVLVDTNFTLAASVVPVDATCGICNGEATVSPTGGSGSYTVLWADGTTGTTVTDLCSGFYPFEVQDNSSGCSVQLDATINDNGGPTGETINTTDVTCNGGNDGSAEVLPVGGTLPYSYNWVGISNATNMLNSASAGNYILQVIDSNGCQRNVPVEILEPIGIDIQYMAIDGTCGNADGEISLIVSGGATPYNYLWTAGPSAGVIGSTNSAETSLLPGVYTVEITDNSGCTESINIPLGTTNGPSLVISATDESCNSLCDGSANVVATGNGPFNYLWSSGGGIDTETGLCEGSYIVTVTDALGCVSNGTALIEAPDPLVLGLPAITDASCDIACDGVATVIVSGGTLTYTFTWDGGQSSQTATGLCVGVNNVNITDANGCELQTSVVIDYNDLLTSTVVETDAACGLCDGEATVSGAGGSGNYTITWYDGTSGTTHTDLCAGIYPYTLLDNANGCSTDLEATINNIDGPDSDVVVITDVTCGNGSDGGADVTVSGGTLPYTYLWVPTGQTSNILSNVPAGTYNLEVSDSNDCKRVVPVTILDGVQIDVTYLSTGSNCGSSDGSIDLIITGGNAPYSTTWSGPTAVVANTIAASGLAAGTYTVVVTDNTGCTETIIIPLSTTNPPSANVTTSDVTCFGASDGSLTANGAGLTFEWQDGSTNATLGSVGSGQYFVTATDPGTGCSAVFSGIVNEPDSLALGIQFALDPLCNGDCNGEVSAIVDGGTLPYTYGWSSSANTAATESGLCDGVVTLTITDANGCNTNGDITLVAPTAITIVVDNITDAQCVNSQDGAVDITATGGTGTLSYSWITIPAGFTSTSEDITGLDPMTYEVTVTDANGCTAVETADVDTITIVLANAGIDTAFCFNNCAVLTGSYSAPVVPSYEWNTVPATFVVSTEDTVQICPTTVGVSQLTLTVTALNCTHTDTVNVELYPLPTVDAGADIEEVLSSTQTLGGSPTGPIGSLYFWTPNTNFVTVADSAASNPQIDLLTEMDYFVFVTDTNGCMNSDTIHVRPIPQIVFPNGFTPNADGVNDDWQIDYIDQFPECEVEIYNRWGEMLFYSKGYTDRWDGTYDGKDLPVGTYYYIIELNDPLFPETYSGPITIMR
ncbi:MAG: gliding motility-associated C-terminal domain-containing protein [Flavobacteriales bacterium]|nr:gliding motility-associated C-terminal domain-containing protein [Flavobacteriales bacterium]